MTGLGWESDKFLDLNDRSAFANARRAGLFVSIHFNGFDKKVRGVEAFVRPAESNVNIAEDTSLAQRVKTAVLNTI